MKLEYDDILEPEDVHRMNTKDRFDKKLEIEDVNLSHSVPIVVRYDYLDLDATDYHFKQPFTHRDTIGYFSRMKYFAGKSVDKLLAQGDDFHFYRSVLRGKLIQAVRKALPHSVESELIVYHFSLYESDEWADRQTDTRNSRVYFVLGTYGHIYILFFDPYHELNPLPKTS